MDGGYHAGRSLSCRAESTGQADQSKGRMEQSERGSGFSQYHGCPPHTHSRCNSGDLGVHPGRGPCGACVLTCRDQQALKEATRLISSLGYPVFRPPPPARLSTGAHQNPSSSSTLCLIAASTTHPPAAVRDIATSFSFRGSGFSSLGWIYRLPGPQERAVFPPLGSWDTSSSQSVPCTDLQRATADTRRPNATTQSCASCTSSTTPDQRRDL